jgi:hypothetical protein
LFSLVCFFLSKIYSSSEVHVSASEFETLGNTVLEAFSCGIPVVVPKTQGFSDTVKDKIDGFLFTAGDCEDAKKYLQLLKDNDKLRKEMGQSGRNAVLTQTIQYVVEDLFTWYNRGISKRSSKPLSRWLLSFFLMITFVPTTIFMFFIYDIMVRRSFYLWFFLF